MISSKMRQILVVSDRLQVEQQKFGTYLEHEKTSVEVARVDENSTELSTLE